MTQTTLIPAAGCDPDPVLSPHIPLPSAPALEDMAIPSVEWVVETVRKHVR